MDIYENIIVGNFLFGLGVKMGIRHRNAPVDPISINLLQQNPLDQRLGDVVVTSAKIFRLIEFKRENSKDDKEPKKMAEIRRKLLNDLKEPKLVSLSRKVHWYVNSDFQDTQDFQDTKSRIKIMPYIDFLESKNFISISQFIDETAIEATDSVVDERELILCERYLEVVAGLWGNPSKVNSPGCLLLVVADGGQLQYAVVDDIGHLIKSRQQVIEMTLERPFGREMTRDRPFGREMTRERPLGREMTRER
jgi:hypothetical protein